MFQKKEQDKAPSRIKWSGNRQSILENIQGTDYKNDQRNGEKNE